MQTPSIIKPTIGRRVWYWPSTYDTGCMETKPPTVMEFNGTQPCDAGVVYVHGDRLVNLSVTDHNGNVHKRNSVTLHQPGDVISAGGGYAVWMDYQISATLESTAHKRSVGPSEILRYFNCGHLPEYLQEIAEPFFMTAEFLDQELPGGAEKATALRKLLEAKDCAIRAALDATARNTALNVQLRATDTTTDLRDVVSAMTHSPDAVQHTENPDHGFDDDAIGDRSHGVGEGPAGEIG
ncbi:MAG: Erwinia phage vB EamM Alexandra [Pseudomonadota bacterium]|jgi:hypothetical protein